MSDTIVMAEMQALQLLIRAGEMSMDTNANAHEAGNKIIELAERIKAQRAVAAMNKES